MDSARSSWLELVLTYAADIRGPSPLKVGEDCTEDLDN